MSNKMERRAFLRMYGGGALTTILLSSKLESARLPNIVVIMGDDLGYSDLSCYGSRMTSTPNCDRLAREGRRFTDAHTPSAVCSPTRYGLLTGRYCWRTRLQQWVCTPDDPLLIDTRRMTVASLLKKHGYATGCVGKWHLGFGTQEPADWNRSLRPGPLDVGFDYYFGVPTSNNWPPFVYVENDRIVGRKPDERIVIDLSLRYNFKEISGIANKRKDEEIGQTLAEKAVQFIERNKEKPFFLYLPTCAVHLPITPGSQVQGTSRAGKYGDFVHEFDWTVGRALDTLDRHKLTDNTLVIVTSDNGALESPSQETGHSPNGPLRGQKAEIYEGGHRVPFIARWPAKIPAGTTCEEVVCLTDLLATFAELLGEPLPHNAGEDSYSILPALCGEKLGQPIREATVHHSVDGTFAIRQGPWKLILGPGSGRSPDVVVNRFNERIPKPPGPGEPRGQLYNLAKDPAEQDNVYNEHPQIVDALSALLERYRQQGYSRPTDIGAR